MSSIQPVSFCGKISVISYTRVPDTIEHFTTTKAQDAELFDVAKDIAHGIGSVRPLSREAADLFHSLIEKIVGKKIRTIGGQRNIYVDQKGLTYADRFARQLGGTRVHVDF